jgi:hypothetical protein
MKDRRGSGGGNGGRPMSDGASPALSLRHGTCGSLSDVSSASTGDGLLENLSA